MDAVNKLDSKKRQLDRKLGSVIIFGNSVHMDKGRRAKETNWLFVNTMSSKTSGLGRWLWWPHDYHLSW